MPFFSCTGQTGTGSVFNRAFGLTLDETYESCLWLVNCLAELREMIGVPRPGVVITDFDDGIKKALKVAFPGAQQQICIFHINKNITGNIPRLWKNSDSEPSAHRNGVEINDEDLDTDARCYLQKLNKRAKKAPVSFTLPKLDSIPLTKEGLYKIWEIIVYSPSLELAVSA